MDDDGSIIWTRKSHSSKPVTGLDLSSKGDYIVYTVDDTLKALSRTGNIRWEKLIAGAKGVALSADGSYTAVVHNNRISVFNRNGDLIADIPDVNDVKDLSFSDDGEYLAFCTDDTSGLFQMLTKGSSGDMGDDFSLKGSEPSDNLSEDKDKSGLPDGIDSNEEVTDNIRQSGSPVTALAGIFLLLLISGYISGRKD
jgi:hypothetical protein